MRSKRPGSLEDYWHRHSCAENVSAITFGVGRVNDLRPRAQCAHGRKLLDGKPSIAMPFNASTRAPITQCNSLRRIDAGIWLDVAAAVT
jgi:hypothetical protein